jgi:hypothetical protein
MPPHFRHASILAAALLFAAAGAPIALAQDEPQPEPEEQAAPPAPELPWVVGDNTQMKWELEDPDLREVMSSLIGSFETGDSAYTPGGVHFHSAPVVVDGLNNAVFFEIHRADDVANSFQFGVLHAYRNEGEPRIRFFEFASQDQGPAVSGLWLAPYAFPTLTLDDLRPVMDIALDPSNWSGRTPHPYPTVRDGAVELTSEFGLTGNGFELADRGYNGAGEQVWGVAEGQTLSFARFEPEASAHTTEGGAIVLDLVNPEDAKALESGGEIAVHYTGYLLTGKQFDSSRTPERGPFRVQIPGQLINGWNEGLIGIKQGGRRRLVIPPHLGYGDRDVGRGLIPANSTLVFDIEAMWIENPDAAEEPAQGEEGHEGHDHGGDGHDHGSNEENEGNG